MEYTEDQNIALNNMLAWSTNNVWRHTLNGAAGTGKTTILKEFLNRVSIPKHKIAVSAPTHKAKKVAQDATNVRAYTIQKLLGLRPNVEMDDFNPHKPVFLPMAEEIIGDFKIVIIDEASMLNKAACDLIEDRAQKYNTKVLFVGDSYQLPPVKEIISPVFKGDVENISMLTTVVRQANENPMTEILLGLREDIKFKTQNTIQLLQRERNKILGEAGFKVLGNGKNIPLEQRFGIQLLNYYLSTEYQHNKNHIKFITYTNKDVELWCEGLRNQILKEKAKDLITVGEVLTGYKTISDKKHNSIIIQNSEDYEITKLEYAESEGLNGFYTTLKNPDDITKTVFIVDLNDKDTEDKYKTKVFELIRNAEEDRRAWKQYYAFVERHLSLKTYMRPDKKWKTLISKDLYYGYGITVHKSQGSTFDNVAVNVLNLYINKDIHERNRLIYVALSRAKNMNLLLM